MNTEIAKRITEARENAGLSIADVYKALKCSRQTPYSWEESGEIREDTLEKFCKLTNSEPSYIRYGVSSNEVHHLKKINSLLSQKFKESFLFSKNMMHELNSNDVEIEFKIMEWKFQELMKGSKQSDVQQMAAFSKFIQVCNLDSTNTVEEN